MAKQERLQSQLRLRLPTRKTVIQTFHLITTATRGEGAVGRRGGAFLCSLERRILRAVWKQISFARLWRHGVHKSFKSTSAW